jgi:predicted DCC family thiol-disulfide oxidoreductase YuxK
MQHAQRPLLIYDGDCGFCGYWARYWQRLTGEAVEYRPYQEVAAEYPAITLADFQRAVQYVAPGGQRASAAEASFLTLSHAGGKGIWLWLYRRVPGFAPAAEGAYAFVAAHRAAFYRVSLLLWGKDYAPPHYDLVSFIFLRLFGVIYFAAFFSFAVQAQGLIGSHGILPLAELIDFVARNIGVQRFFLMPMVFWWNSSDLAIQAACWAGCAASLFLVLNFLPRPSLLLVYVLYLSLLYAGGVFMNFQWDVFLLETGFLAFVLTFAPRTGIWLLRWLLFRFTFMSGAVKLLSGDPTWWNLSALSYHFLTQPLPTPLAWYAAHLPPDVLRFATAATFVIELGLPLLIFLPRRLRQCAAFGFLLLQVCILSTGNYNWFNLQTMLLCLTLFDDAALRRVLPRRLLAWLPVPLPKPGGLPSRRWASAVLAALALLIVSDSLVHMQLRFGGRAPAAVLRLVALIEPLHIVNAYGLFAIMTTERDEIVIEGSEDGTLWREYEFRYKPGALERRPPWNIPHQPRLDWQMWFAALEDPHNVAWFPRFLARLLQNEPAVTALLAKNPFADHAPKFVRAKLYQYTYANAQEKAQGQWWNRRFLRYYFPPVRLRPE